MNEAFEQARKSIGDFSTLADSMLKNLMPTSTPKSITIEIVEKKGWFGFGRKVKKVQADAYISMNNILNIDFKDKNELQNYYNNLK